MHSVMRASFLSKFQCLGAECEDNCCGGWTVQADAPTVERWKKDAPELMDFIEEKPGIGCALKFDSETGRCPKLDGGWCSIHTKYGEDFLTDTCHLYPRITRGLGAVNTMSASVSCPEIARLCLYGDAPFALEPGEYGRIPTSLKQYLPAGMTPDEALALHRRFMEIPADVTAERYLMRLATFAHGFATIPLGGWAGAMDKAWGVIDQYTPPPEPNPNDLFFLLIVLSTLVKATGLPPSERLKEVIRTIERALHCEVLWDEATVNTSNDSVERIAAIRENWRTHHAAAMDPLLKRLLQAQMSACLYPFAGLGTNPVERIAWIASHFATIRLGMMALAAEREVALMQAEIVLAVQAVTRILEHLGNLNFALPMYLEAGWLQPGRLMGMIAE